MHFKRLKTCLLKGIEGILNEKENLDRYNEFPVADHDAGVNACLTLNPLLKFLIENSDEPLLFIEKFREKLEYSSAGNTGIILSFFIPEFLKIFAEEEKPSRERIRKFFEQMISKLKSTFGHTPEGTPLSLFEYIKENPEILWEENFPEKIEIKLKEWAEMLEPQRKKGVPDSGLYALCIFIREFMKAMETDESFEKIIERIQHRGEEKEFVSRVYREKIAILVDSSADISHEIAENYRIGVIPLQIIIGAKRFREEIDIKRSVIYEKIRLIKEKITTSQPAKYDIEKSIRDVIEKAKKVLVITISKGLSGTWNAVRSVADKIEKRKIFVFDSGSVSLALTLFALRAREKLQKGMSFEDMLEYLHEIKERSFLFFSFRTFKNIIKSGRISWAQGKLAGLLRLRPVMTLEDGKEIKKIRVALGDKGVMKKILSILKEKIDASKYYDFGIAHIGREDVVRFFKEELPRHFRVRKFLVSSLSPAISIHVGYGAFGVFAIPYM